MIARRTLNVSTLAPTRLMNHDDVHGVCRRPEQSNRPVRWLVQERERGADDAALSAPPSEKRTRMH